MGVVKPFLMVMFAANVINLPVCAFFILYMRLGVDGAAISLVIMGLNLSVLSLVYIVRSGVYRGTKRERTWGSRWREEPMRCLDMGQPQAGQAERLLSSHT